MVRRGLFALVVLTTLFAGVPVSAQSEIDRARERAEAAAEAADDARDRAAEAQDRAEQAVLDLEIAEGLVEDVDEDIETVEADEARARAEVDELERNVTDLFVRAYVSGDRTPALVVASASVSEGVRAQTLAAVAYRGSADEIDRYRVVKDDLARAERRLRELRTLRVGAVATLEETVGRLDVELATIKAELELAEEKEAELATELERLEEEERRRIEEERRRREAERQARLERERQAREAEARRIAEEQAAARAAAEAEARRIAEEEAAERGEDPPPTTDGGDGSDGDGGAPTTQPPTTTEPARPEPVIVGSDGFLCPVAGPVAFSDTWGAPRSGGRRHKGVDMFAERGTPVVAPVSGTVTHRSVRLGGPSFFLDGDDGNRYFGTHLNDYGQGGYVQAGTVIGYVGNTGNARWASPHLHFEIHPGGGSAVNPYPTTKAACG